MSKANLIQTDFTAGEISLACMGRVDLQKYAHAAELMRNFTISPQGGAIRRSGTRYVSAVPVAANFTRLIDFRFSSSDAVVIELSNLEARFYKNQGIVISGGSPYSVTTPYLSTDLPLLKFTQSASIIYFFHPNYSPQMFSRFADTNWTVAAIPLADGPYLDYGAVNGVTYATGTTLTAGSVTPGVSTSLVASTAIFAATDVGRFVRFYNGSSPTASTNVGNSQITAYTSPTQVTMLNITGMSAGPYSTWQLGAFSGTTGYPTCGTFFQQRLCMANTPSQPQTFFMSQSGQIYNFAPSLSDTTVTDSCAIVYTIASNQVNSIEWMSSSQVLIIGTSGGEWQAASSNLNSAPITPSNIDVAPQTTNGSFSSCRPMRIGWETVYVSRTGRDVYKLVFTFQVNGFQSFSLTLLGEHIPREGNQLIDLAYQQFPHSILWFPRQADGCLAACTYLAEQQVIGWHLHTIGGSWGSGNAFVESIAVIPTPDGTKDQLWMVVKRTVNGSTVRYVEYMEVPYYSSDTPQAEACFVDSAISYSGSPATVFAAPHLKGQQVSVLADGGEVDGLTVDATTGNVTLPNAASNVTLGLAYVSQMKVLRLEGGGSAGTAQAKVKRVQKFGIRLFESIGFEWSVDGTNWTEVDFRDAAYNMGEPIPLFTGDQIVPIDMPYEYEGQYWIQQTSPYPLTILAVLPEAMVNQ